MCVCRRNFNVQDYAVISEHNKEQCNEDLCNGGNDVITNQRQMQDTNSYLMLNLGEM